MDLIITHSLHTIVHRCICENDYRIGFVVGIYNTYGLFIMTLPWVLTSMGFDVVTSVGNMVLMRSNEM